ncbi:hypothetical protein H920_15215 [Fukomys damarensis]|uniref:Uncharacterized protein n=1 Tax=Fukomys damarensis TaxID=885580 RepID=A0A091CUS5_FUKDA|nr:hypothetical protein H920_15215 [Fukomys damarensis]
MLPRPVHLSFALGWNAAQGRVDRIWAKSESCYPVDKHHTGMLTLFYPSDPLDFAPLAADASCQALKPKNSKPAPTPSAFSHIETARKFRSSA